MRRKLFLTLAAPAVAAALLAGCQSVPSNGQCNPEYAPFAFGETSNWLMIVGPAGCADTLNLFGAMMTNSTIVTPPANGTAFVQGTSYGYTPRAGFTGTDQFVMALTGRGNAGTATSQVIVKVQVKQ
ncbi:Ig-like domain-containing protein [Alsobacter sp. R-9]